MVCAQAAEPCVVTLGVVMELSGAAGAYGQAAAPDDPDDLIMFRRLLEAMLEGSYWG